MFFIVVELEFGIMLNWIMVVIWIEEIYLSGVFISLDVSIWYSNGIGIGMVNEGVVFCLIGFMLLILLVDFYGWVV